MTQPYQICSRCIMDTSDPDIAFNENGVCSHCRRYVQLTTDPGYLAKRTPGALEAVLQEIKSAGKGKPYDCIIGVSGGVDSTYVAYLCKKLGLRPLAVHLDNGWDSELAVSNVERIIDRLGIDLYTIVLDWDSFRDLQVAFLKASTPDSEIPTDHAILAALYKVAVKFDVRYIIGGHNTATEGGGVRAWSQGHADWRYVRGIHRRFGSQRLRAFPHYGPLRFLYYRLARRIQWVSILDYVDYDKHDATRIIQEVLGWRPYAAKHGESTYTAFYQDYILAKKFGFEKKRLHLSSLIWSGQLSRAEALQRVSQTPSEREIMRARTYVTKKLGLTREEFDAIMAAPPKRFEDYPSYKRMLRASPRIVAAYHRMKRT